MDTVLYVPSGVGGGVVRRNQSTSVPPVVLPEVLSPAPVASARTLVLEVIQPGGSARIERARRTNLGGLAIEVLGLCLLLFWPLGTLVGLILLVAGHQASKAWRCGACRNFVADSKVRICASCRAHLR